MSGNVDTCKVIAGTVVGIGAGLCGLYGAVNFFSYGEHKATLSTVQKITDLCCANLSDQPTAECLAVTKGYDLSAPLMKHFCEARTEEIVHLSEAIPDHLYRGVVFGVVALLPLVGYGVYRCYTYYKQRNGYEVVG